MIPEHVFPTATDTGEFVDNLKHIFSFLKSWLELPFGDPKTPFFHSLKNLKLKSSIRDPYEWKRGHYQIYIKKDLFFQKTGTEFIPFSTHDKELNRFGDGPQIILTLQYKLFVYPRHEHEKRHSYLSRGTRVLFSGCAIFQEGRLIQISNASGHYQTPWKNIKTLIQFLQAIHFQTSEMEKVMFYEQESRLLCPLINLEMLERRQREIDEKIESTRAIVEQRTGSYEHLCYVIDTTVLANRTKQERLITERFGISSARGEEIGQYLNSTFQNPEKNNMMMEQYVRDFLAFLRTRPAISSNEIEQKIMIIDPMLNYFKIKKLSPELNEAYEKLAEYFFSL